MRISFILDYVYLLDLLKWVYFFVGNTETYSEIFMYDIHNEQFVSYQKILTHAAVDIKYFCFMQNRRHEHFLVVANSYEIGNIHFG